jgi:hypothetical protein
MFVQLTVISTLMLPVYNLWNFLVDSLFCFLLHGCLFAFPFPLTSCFPSPLTLSF